MKRVLLTLGFAVLGLMAASAGDKVWNNYPETRNEIVQLRTTAFAVGIDTSRKGEVAWLKSCLSGVDFAAGTPARDAPGTRGTARDAPETGVRPLFRLKFVPCENVGGRKVELTPADAGSFRAETPDRRLRLVYSDFPGGACERVECTLSVERNDNFLYWDIAVTSAPGWKLVWSSYPELPLVVPLKRTDPKVASPTGDGRRGESMAYAEKDGSLFCRMDLRGGRVATTAYDLGPDERPDAALLSAIRTAEDVEGVDAGQGAEKVLFLGNSINGTGPANRWDGCWGMCASWPQKDYVHLVVKGLERRQGRRVSWRRRNLAEWERNLATFDVKTRLAKELAFKPDLVVVALGENVPSFRSAEDRALFWVKFLELAQMFKAQGAKLLIRSPFWSKAGHREIQRSVADEVGAAFADLKAFGQDAEWQAQGSTTDAGVAWHPGDKGMRRIADEILARVGEVWGTGLPARDAPGTRGAARDAPETGVRRVGVVNWDCSVPSTTYFGKATCNTLGPAKWRDRTPYYAEVKGPDRIEHHDRTLAEYETEMQYAIDAGIDYFAYCWYDLNPPPGDKSKCAGKLQEITRARRLHVKSALRNRLSLCAILVTSHPYSDDCLKDLAAEMRNPWYEKANGRPLVYMFSSTTKVAPRLREICRVAGAGDPYVVAMITEPPANCTNSFVHADALCCYACTEEGPEPEAYADMAVQWNAIRATAGLPVVPQFATGWDPRPRMERSVPWASYPDKPWAGKLSAEIWLDQAAKLRTWIARNPKACPTGHVMAFAWNEFEEGGWICPNVGRDGKPDTTRVRAFRRVVETLKAPSLDAEGTLGRHGYFTDEALKAADVTGLSDDIALALARSDRAFELAAKTAAALDGHDRIALERRMEIAHRLKRYVAKRASAPERDEQILAWQGAKDLDLMYDYFAKEAKRREGPGRDAPATVHELNVRDFGAKGDGVQDDGPAIRAALDAAKRLGGTPCVVRLPAGTYRVGADPRSPFKDFKLRDWQTGENRGPTPYWTWSSTSLHLMLLDLDRVTVRGEGEKTVVAFADSTKGGFGLYGCSECAIENLTVDYPDNPSTQGVVERVEHEPFALVIRRQKGYPDPDSPRFLKATSRYFSPVGADGHYLPTGVGRLGPVERVAGEDGLFRLMPLPQHAKNEVWRGMKAGDRLCIVARYAENSANPVKAQWSAFCAVRNVRFLDSPGQLFWFSGCYAYSIVGCRATGRDGSDDWVKGNADAILGSGLIGPYVSDCVFSGLEDDGINIGANTGEITSVPASRRLSQCRTNGSQPAAGGFVSDGVDARIKAFFRYGNDDVQTQPLPESVVSAADLRGGEDAKKAWFDRVGAQKRGVRRSDKNIRIPNTSGAVLRNTEFSHLRGRGIQVHCGNMLIENVNVHDVTGVGISIHALISWSMCYDIYNILVRNCTFERIGGGHAVTTHPDELVPEDPIMHRMHFGIDVENCTIDPGGGKTGVFAAHADDVTVKSCTFGPGCSAPPVKQHQATRVQVR